MTFVKQAAIELILLTLASVGVALAANEFRARKSIDLTKDYFRKGSGAPLIAGGSDKIDAVRTSPAPAHHNSNKLAESASEAPGAKPHKSESETRATPLAANAISATKKHLEHDFQTITVDGAHEILDDPKTAQGLNVFVDARDDDHFAEGHIPGAMQCFPYETKRCLDRVMAAANGAEKVIVYCGGGDCEDSIFMSRELQEAGVPHDAIYLFEGGWKEWLARELHVETGSK